MVVTISRLSNFLDRTVDWFIPQSIAADKSLRKQARLFLISHLLGPFIGNTVPLSLYIFDPTPSWDVAVLALSITGFWIFPFVLRAIGRYNTLAMISIQNLIFCILWSCYFYGGVTSPTLPWMLTIPLLAFFYIGESASLRYLFLGMFAGNLIAFSLISYFVPPPGHEIPLHDLQGLGIVSTVAAATYVLMMAIYYARALSSQAELEALMRHQRSTMQDLRLATAEAERAGRAKAEFLAKMSHELRTPLNAIIGYSSMLLEDAEHTGETEDVPDLKRTHAAGIHLLRLVNNVLDLSKIEAGHMEIFANDFSLEGVVSAVVAEAEEQASANGNEIHVEIEPGLDIMHTDQMKTRSVIGNVVQNAMKYTKDGRVDVLCRAVATPEGRAVQIEVRDTGIGIDPREQANIFEQFAIVDEQTSTKYGGTGVGLALTRELCRMMGGKIEVASKLGVGSTFTITLPVVLSQQPDTERLHDVLAEADAAYPEWRNAQKPGADMSQKVPSYA